MIRIGRPSPALVVAVLALVAALAGTAVAGPNGSTSAISKKKVKKIVTKQINDLAPGLSVASAETANTANTANTATVGAPAAYASINADGSVDAAMPSRGIDTASVNRINTGLYCFDLAFAPKTAAVNPIQEGPLADDAILSYSFDPGDYVGCPASAEAEVTNLDNSDGNLLQNDDFNVQFDG